MSSAMPDESAECLVVPITKALGMFWNFLSCHYGLFSRFLGYSCGDSHGIASEEDRKVAFIQFLVFHSMMIVALFLALALVVDSGFSSVALLFFFVLAFQSCIQCALHYCPQSVGTVTAVWCFQMNAVAVWHSLSGGSMNDLLCWCAIIPMLLFFVCGKKAGMATLNLILLQCVGVFMLKELNFSSPAQHRYQLNLS